MLGLHCRAGFSSGCRGCSLAVAHRLPVWRLLLAEHRLQGSGFQEFGPVGSVVGAPRL